ncbi:MAG: hypothetical protein NTW59_03665 [Candidatus Diapherotrites archaeon]|nr:hypothetical protein [Candidatus Diapherotrites archaeon]
MQTSDLILGLLIILLCGWVVMLSVNQSGLAVSVNALNIKQSSQSVLVSPNYCKQIADYSLVRAADLREKEYFMTAGFNSDTNRVFLCLYEQG